jgi:hypothetical protein
MGTAWENAVFSRSVREAYLGWIGLDLYDEGNAVGMGFIDRFEQRYGRRLEYFVPVVSRDFAMIVVQALTADGWVPATSWPASSMRSIRRSRTSAGECASQGSGDRLPLPNPQTQTGRFNGPRTVLV